MGAVAIGGDCIVDIAVLDEQRGARALPPIDEDRISQKLPVRSHGPGGSRGPVEYLEKCWTKPKARGAVNDEVKIRQAHPDFIHRSNLVPAMTILQLVGAAKIIAKGPPDGGQRRVAAVTFERG